MSINPNLIELINNDQDSSKEVKEFALKVINYQVSFSDTRSSYVDAFKAFLNDSIKNKDQLSLDNDQS